MGNKQSHKKKPDHRPFVWRSDESLWVVGTKIYWEEEYAHHQKLVLGEPPKSLSPIATSHPDTFIIKKELMEAWIEHAKQKVVKRYFDRSLYTFEKIEQKEMNDFVFHRGMGQVTPPTLFAVFQKSDVLRLHSLDINQTFDFLPDDEPFMLMGFLVTKTIAMKGEKKRVGISEEHLIEEYKSVPRTSLFSIISVLPYDVTKIPKQYERSCHYVVRKWISFMRMHKCEELDDLMCHSHRHMVWKLFLSHFYKGEVGASTN
uniref:Uncharacterized protein n=1 Tax=Clandestinovirus TaxID=2831644 RepID=A0A8F8KQ48_9VIRU|nr:hypothetical protein KOM_12_477 [Clandestinovirus]